MLPDKEELKVPAFLRKKKPKQSKAKLSSSKKKPKAKKPAKKALPKKKKKLAVKKPARKRPAKKIKTAPPKIERKVVKKPELEKVELAVVSQYFEKINVAILKLSSDIWVNSTVEFSGENSFKQKIYSMQFEHKPIKRGKRGQEVGIKVEKPVRVGDKVYSVKTVSVKINL